MTGASWTKVALLALLLNLISMTTSARLTDHGLPQYEPRLGRSRPVIAVLGYNPATETTDYVVPYGILAEAGVAEVFALATHEGAVEMRPALRFEVQATLQEFDRRFPEGADYVIVPNIYEGAKDERVLEWVRNQSRLGATIVGVCDGVPVLANAGLLEGRRATAHWRTIDGLERTHGRTEWVRNRRYVADGNVITTSGVSASIPISIALIEAIAGEERATAVARNLGVTRWAPDHDSKQFRLGGSFLTALGNKLMFWRHESLGLEVYPGIDEISLALTADMYSRTRRSWAFTVSETSAPLPTKRGLRIIPDRAGADRNSFAAMLEVPRAEPASALERSLDGIESRYGEATAAFVAVQIEHPWRD